MQYADDHALAEALSPGGTVEVGYRLLFDWRKDGQFDTEAADLSDNFADATLDAQFTGSYPAEFEVNDGYAQRRLTVHVTGEVLDGVHALRFFSPYSGQWGGQVGAVNTPMYFEVLIRVADGSLKAIRQFTGFLIQATPKRSDGTVELECADITSQLTNGLTFYPSARSQALAQWGQNSSEATNDRMRQRGGNSLSWFLIHAARSSGLYQGPKPPAGCLAYWTLTGGVLPEVGTLSQMPRDGRQSWPVSEGSWIMSARQQSFNELPRYYHSFDYDTGYPSGAWSPDIITPEVYPRYMWNNGPYGPEMRFDVYNTDTSITGRVVDRMHCVGATSEAIYISPASSYCTRLGLGGWHRFDSTVDGYNYTRLNLMLTSASQGSEAHPGDVNRTGYLGPVGYIEFHVDARTGAMDLSLSYTNGATGWSGFWHWLGGSAVHAPADGAMHYVAASIEFPATGAPTVRFNVDGKVSVIPVDAQPSPDPTYPTGKATYTTTDGRVVETNTVIIDTSGGAQHWGAWQQVNVPKSTAVPWSNDPACLDYTTATDIGRSMARVMWTPSVIGKAAWDVMKEVGSADLGTIYTDEYGILRYANWEDMIAARDTGRNTLTLSLDDVNEVDPYTTFDSVANQVTYSSQDKYACDEAIFKATDPQQFQVASGRTARWQTTVEDCMSVLPGPITPRRLAQGYWSTTAGSGDNPMVKRSNQNANGDWYDYWTAAFLPKDFMDAYKPDVWKNGFEGHNRGDLVGANTDQQRPSEGLGVFAYAAPGWAPGDLDPRHVTIILGSGNAIGGRTTMAAVDDSTPFLNIRGYKLEPVNDKINTAVNTTDTSSFEHFGVRNITRPDSDWAADYYTQYDLTQRLADELAQPRPVFSSLETRGDPRRQLQDVVAIDDADGLGGPMYCSVVGINRQYSNSDGVKETLALRTFGPRTGFWILDDQSFSRLDETTLLA